MKKLLLLSALSVALASCNSGPSVPYNQQQTERLHGTWQFAYSVDGTGYTRTYKLSDLKESTVAPGEYNLWGTDEYGDPVLGGYDPEGKMFTLYDPSVDFDRFYIFNLNSAAAASGCYYQVYADDTDSGCIPFSGTRIGTSASLNRVGTDSGELKKGPSLAASSVALDLAGYRELREELR